MMIFINEISKFDKLPRTFWEGFVKLLSPYAPHLCEELWQKLGHDKTIAYEAWPTFNEDFAKDDCKTIVVSVNGKVRANFQTAAGTPKESLEKLALETEGAKKFTQDKEIVKIIVVPDKLVNIVVK